VNAAFRQYAITGGNPRVGRLFKKLDVPLDIVLNAAFPAAPPSVWNSSARAVIAENPLARPLSAQQRISPVHRINFFSIAR
jgi:hypothetical protein